MFDKCLLFLSLFLAWCWGDPHITNLDGGVYTFNGWGEYTLLQISTSETSFVLQGRTHPVTNSTATQLVALAFGLSKYSAVEVRYYARCKRKLSYNCEHSLIINKMCTGASSSRRFN